MTRTVERPGTAPELPVMPRVNDATRREFLVGTAGLLLLSAACGGNGQGREERAGGGTRAVEHVLGTTEVPAELRRVVALDPYVSLPTALLLGVPVVGTGYIPAGEPFPPFLDEDETEEIENVGWLEFNLERIAALEPDLIIGQERFVVEEVYEELSRIAPTVATGYEIGDWRGNLRAVAGAFGQTEEVERRISEVEGRMEEFRETRGEVLERTLVSLVNIREAEDIRVYTEHDFAGSILEDAGVRRPEAQRASEPDENIKDLSQELLPQIDADVIVYYVGSAGGDYEESQAALERIQENLLWQNLRAVQNDRTYRVDAAHWFATNSLQAVNLVLDDLEEIFASLAGERA
jgi:iron complex transport system substrate-binding protein